MLQLTNLPPQVYLFAALLAILSLAFVVMFLVPGIMLRWKLSQVIARFKTTVRRKQDPTPLFAHDKTLKHVWSEFNGTLHKQTELNRRTGAHEVVALRSTVPAEFFFNCQVLVDNRLRTEFFKHVPGIFTGVGIIGTFYGLISGLQVFRVSQNQAVVLDSLNGLLHGVWQAFLISALAISLAMVVTVVEKFLIAGLYRKVEELCQLLDSQFEAGAGEEYLSRLVRSSEQQASQAKGLKDALIGEIKEALRESVGRQIAAANEASASLDRSLSASITRGHQQLGQAIAINLEASLGEPMRKIAAASAGLRDDQNAALGDTLTDVLGRFSERMENLFGGQIEGINELQQKAVEALQSTVMALERTATGIEKAGTAAADTMAAKLAQSAVASEGRQRALTDQVSSIAAAMQSITTGATTGMNAGAQTLHAAASNFAQAGESVSSVMNQAIGATTLLARAANSIIAATGSLDSTVADHRASRDAIARMVTELRTIVDAARKEAGLTKDVLERIDGAAAKLATAGREADHYLDRVTDVLTMAHGTFADNMQRVLGTANRQFYEELSKATGLLREGIQELEVALIEAPAQRLS